MFLETERRIRERAVQQMFNVALRAPTEESVRAMRLAEEAKQRQHSIQEQHASGSAVAGITGQTGERAPQTVVRDQPKVGRNEPCPCGSGKKYKKCHGQAA